MLKPGTNNGRYRLEPSVFSLSRNCQQRTGSGSVPALCSVRTYTWGPQALQYVQVKKKNSLQLSQKWQMNQINSPPIEFG